MLDHGPEVRRRDGNSSSTPGRANGADGPKVEFIVVVIIKYQTSDKDVRDKLVNREHLWV